jgi:hypothetical protein
MKPVTVRATLSRKEDVSISPDVIQELVLDVIHKACDIPRSKGYGCGWHIKDGKLVEYWEERGGSHSWEEEKVVRDANPTDLAAAEVIKQVREYFKC